MSRKVHCTLAEKECLNIDRGSVKVKKRRKKEEEEKREEEQLNPLKSINF